MKQKLLSFIFVLFCLIGQSIAQSRQVSGKVTSSTDGSALSGVSVAVAGTNAATQTDGSGNYSINVAGNAALVFTYVGYMDQRVSVGNRSTINVVLQDAEKALDEIIVVAYGTSSKSSFTGAASSVKSEVIENRSITSITKALDGAAPGVVSTAGSGQPGSGASIRVRGFGSINASADPLYVVDGVPFTGDLNSINPNDVESLTVLKDAAASTLYGSRAANGVVMITTKSGKNTNRVDVNFKSNWGVASRAVPRYDVMNQKEYLETVFQSYKNREIYSRGVSEDEAGLNAINLMAGPVDPIFGKNEQYNPYDLPVVELFDPVSGLLNPNAKLKWNDDWMKELTAKSPVRQEYQLDLAGGNEKFKAFASMNALKEKGLLKTTAFDRYTGRVNTEFKPNDWFKTSLSANFSKAESNSLESTGSSYSNVWYSAEQMAPIYPIWTRDNTGAFVLGANGERLFDYGKDRASGAQQDFNSIATLYDDRYYDHRNNIGSRAAIEFNTKEEKYGAFQGFTFTVNLGVDNKDNAYTYYYNPNFGNAEAQSGRLNKEWTKTFAYTFNQLLTWDRKFGLHNVDVLVGHESYSYKYNLLSAQKTGFPFKDLFELAPGSTIADANSYEHNERLESYLSRVQYNYDNRYFLSGSFRSDGSSRFEKDNRWGNFWSIGGAWKLSEEEFMKDYSWMNSFTVKASYGTQGNNSLMSGTSQMYYAWQAFYDLTWSNANNSGGAVTSVENKLVSWEKNNSFNVGFDGRFINNRLNVDFDWYTRKTTDMLLFRPLALSTGFDGFNDNVGDMKNTGFDLSIGYDVIKNQDLTWNITAMGSKVKNEVLKLTDEQKEIVSGSTIVRVGEAVNSFYMARSAGVDPSNGDQLYWVYDNKEDEFDLSKHYISSDKSKAAASRVIVGNRIPKLSGSLSTSLMYKGFDFSVMGTYSIGGKIYDQVYTGYENPLYIGNNYHRDVLRAWKKPGDVTDIPRVQKELTNTLTDRAVVDASYFAIKNIAVGYTFNVARLGLQSVRIFAQGDNLAVFSARKGLDPQYNFTGTTNYVYAPNRTISAGVNLKF